MFSVILACRDVNGGLIEATLNSIRTSGHDAVQALLMDYGSAPANSAKYRKLCDSRAVQHIAVDALGRLWNRSHALNIGARHATGEFLVFVDAGFQFSRDFFQQCENHLKGNAVVFGGAYPRHFPGDRDLMTVSRAEPLMGFIAAPRLSFAAANGFDEKILIRDLDFIDYLERQDKMGAEIHKMNARFFSVKGVSSWRGIPLVAAYQVNKSLWYESTRKYQANQFMADLPADWGAPIQESSNRPIIEVMRHSKPEYYAFRPNRVVLDYGSFFQKVVARRPSGLFLLVAMGKCSAKAVFGDTRPILRRALRQIGFQAIPQTNTNLDSFMMSIPGLQAEHGLRDFFILNSRESIYLLFD